MDDQQKLKTRYEVATYAFDEISKRNAELALKGSRPTAEALQSEEAAHQELAAARRAYLESLSATPPKAVNTWVLGLLPSQHGRLAEAKRHQFCIARVRWTLQEQMRAPSASARNDELEKAFEELESETPDFVTRAMLAA
jgi:hypothetical protein